MQLHVDGGEERRGAGIVAHQHHQLDECLRPEQRLRLGEGLRGHLVVAENLPAELDDGRIRLLEPRGRQALLDDVDDARVDAFLARLRFMRGPLEARARPPSGCRG
jgi:hypothetical protein